MRGWSLTDVAQISDVKGSKTQRLEGQATRILYVAPEGLTGKHGIQAARLHAGGAGLMAPVAPNDTDDGRAKNRRVELVKQ